MTHLVLYLLRNSGVKTRYCAADDSGRHASLPTLTCRRRRQVLYLRYLYFTAQYRHFNVSSLGKVICRRLQNGTCLRILICRQRQVQSTYICTLKVGQLFLCKPYARYQTLLIVYIAATYILFDLIAPNSILADPNTNSRKFPSPEVGDSRSSHWFTHLQASCPRYSLYHHLQRLDRCHRILQVHTPTSQQLYIIL